MKPGCVKGLIVAAFLLPAMPTASAEQVLQALHSVSFPQKENQYLQVRLRIPVSDRQLELSLPSWTPGSYVIRDYAANIENLTASGSDGRALSVVKVAKNRWRIDTATAQELVVDYAVWAGEINVSESWVGSDFALLNGAGLFLYNEQTRDWPQRLEILLPASWQDIHTSLPRENGSGYFLARDYDELVDSPVLAGASRAFDFEVDGHPYALVLAGIDTFWDGEKAAEDLAALVKAQQDFWAVNPLERKYLFLNFFIGPVSGLEHDHSTVLMGSRWQMRDPRDYNKWLGLASHEFFHAWNVRRMRPAALSRYDYERESYTRELWLAEGLSSYYDNLLLFRAGLIGVSDYFEMLAREFRDYEITPGRRIRSAELASFDTWIKHYRPDGNSVNSTVSYYRKGALIGFVVDASIRRETGGDASLDTIMREMYVRYGPGGEGKGAYPRGAFAGLLEELAGPEVRGQLENLLQSTTDPDIEKALDWFGLVLDRSPARSAAEAAGLPPPGGLGIDWRVEEGRLMAETVILGHAGASAGVLPGDELLAIDGIRVLPEAFENVLGRLVPGEGLTLTLARNDRLIERPVTVQHALPHSYRIVPRKNIRKREKARLEAWLGRPLKFGQ